MAASADDPFIDFDHYHTLCLEDDPYPVLRTLQQTCPVGWSATHEGSWVLTHYDDIFEAANQPMSFSSGKGVSIPSHGMPPLPPIEYDPPVHNLFRGPLIPRFSPGMVAKYEPHARDIVTDLIDAFIEDGVVDLSQQLTMPFPAIVNTPVLGVPLEDRDKFQHWAVTLMASGGQDLGAIGDCMAYFSELYEMRTAEPLDDIPSTLLAVRIDGEPITEEQFILAMVMLMSAGLDTTTNSGSYMFHYLGHHPEQRARLIENPELIPSAVEEMLRHITPLPSLFRTATHAMTLHGAEIAEGDRVQFCWMAANHDPAEFPDPDTIDFERKPNRHFSFGIGTHRCLGAALARLELKVLLEEALPRLGDYRITAEPVRYSSATRGIHHLHAEFPPGKRLKS